MIVKGEAGDCPVSKTTEIIEHLGSCDIICMKTELAHLKKNLWIFEGYLPLKIKIRKTYIP